jgi:hypothetical protein
MKASLLNIALYAAFPFLILLGCLTFPFLILFRYYCAARERGWKR